MRQSAMRSTARQFIVAATVAIAAIGLLLGSYTYLAGQRESARAAAAELAECHSLSARITGLQQLPARQGAATAAKGELIRQITSAAMAAGFDEDALDRIEPESSRSSGEGAGSLEQARVFLKKVTLRQAVAFFQELDSGNLSLVRIRLVAPAEAQVGNTNVWTVEATLGRGIAGAVPSAARAIARE